MTILSAFAVCSVKALSFTPAIDFKSDPVYFSVDDLMVISESTAVAFAGEPRFQKLKAVVLAVLLGHFGVHRIYLGTKANVPVFYSLTLGGGLGLLPLLDIVALLTVKDLDKYANSDQVIMWLRPKTTPQ